MVDLLVIMVVLAAVAVFVTAPLRRSAETGPLLGEPAAEESAELRELEAARDAKLRELRDAELDHRTGKLSDEDYSAVDATLRAEAIDILRALDEARERASAQLGQSESPERASTEPGQNRKSADTITD